MLPEYQLQWENYNWKRFERMSIAIAQKKFPGADFQEYLKQGNDQQGVDLLSFDYQSGYKLAVQCKREESIGVTELNSIITAFTSKDLSKTCSDFILATSADMQHEKLQKRIDIIRDELKKDFNINFQCWDRNAIEKYLKDSWGIVADYFGKSAADQFCHSQVLNTSFRNIFEVKDYLPRLIYLPSANQSGYYLERDRKLVNLNDLFTNERSQAHKIILLGDAYQGKSSYLRQSAFLLQQSDLRLCPLFLEIKELNNRPIEEILDLNFGAWKTVPLMDLVLFIDGIDEAPTDEFLSVVKAINNFSQKYPSLSIVLSCRSLFFESYNVPNHLKNFTAYALYSLLSKDIETYLQKKLAGQADAFITLSNSKGISDFLYHPFYLVNLCDEYLSNSSMPESKLEVIEFFISKSFKQTLDRQLAGGRIVAQDEHLFKQTAYRFALALQLAEKNSMTNEDMQKLFSSQERELLQHNSVVQINKGNWSLTNAIFQEHFTAYLLAKLDFNTILTFSTVGINIRKIKLRWLQTIASFLSFTEETNPIRKQLITFIEADNIEFLFMTERSKFSKAFRKELLKKLFKKCIDTGTWPLLISESHIAGFIDDIESAVSDLLTLLKSAKTINGKYLIIRTLRYMSVPDDTGGSLLKAIVAEISKTTDPDFAGQCVKLLSSNKLGNKSTLDKLLKLSGIIEQHPFRDGLYDYILQFGLQEEYYDFAIDGIAYYIRHNQSVSHGGSEFNMERVFLATRKRSNVEKIIQKMTDDEWLEKIRYGSSQAKNFITRLMETCEEIFAIDPTVIFPIAKYIKILGRNFLRSEYIEIDDFLERTDTNKLVVRILLNQIFNDNNWELGSLITSDSYDYILFEFEESDFNMMKLKNCMSGLRYKKRDEILDQFRSLCIAVTGGRIVEPYSKEAEEYHKFEAIKRRNDKRYIESGASFRKGLIRYFKAYGKKSIPDNDFYIDVTDRVQRKQTDSNFIFSMLLDSHRAGKPVSQNNLLKFVDKPESFELFRAYEILDYNFMDETDKQFYLPILESYYRKIVSTEKFENCKYMDGETHKFLRRPTLAISIYEKFGFETTDEQLMNFVWVDDAGINSFRESSYNNKKSISQQIINRLDDRGKLRFKQKIVANLKLGIKYPSVLGTHIGLCGHLKIREAKDEILKVIKKKTLGNYYLPDIVKIYLDLGGDTAEIVKIYSMLTAYEEWWYIKMTNIVSPSHPKEAIESLTKAFNTLDDSKVNPGDTKSKVEIARLLANLGELSGFRYLVNELRINRKAPYHIQGTLSIKILDTAITLNEIADTIPLLIDEDLKRARDFHESAPNLLSEWLTEWASKSEADLTLVLAFLETKRKALKRKGITNTTDLFYYQNRLLENFRKSDETGKPVDTIKTLISTINL